MSRKNGFTLPLDYRQILTTSFNTLSLIPFYAFFQQFHSSNTTTIGYGVFHGIAFTVYLCLFAFLVFINPADANVPVQNGGIQDHNKNRRVNDIENAEANNDNRFCPMCDVYV